MLLISQHGAACLPEKTDLEVAVFKCVESSSELCIFISRGHGTCMKCATLSHVLRA